MSARSGTEYIAREVGFMINRVYGRTASNKSISQMMIRLDDEHPMLNRRDTTDKEKALYNCRKVYAWALFGPNGEIM